MSSNEDKRQIYEGERKGVPPSAPSLTSQSSSSSAQSSSVSSISSMSSSLFDHHLVDLDNLGHNDLNSYSSAYNRTAFAQGGDQPATFLNFHEGETYRSVQVHTPLDEESLRGLSDEARSVIQPRYGGGGHGQLIDQFNDFGFGSNSSSSAFGYGGIGSLDLKPAAFGTQSQSSHPGQPPSSFSLKELGIGSGPSFTTVEVPSQSDIGAPVEPPLAPGGYLEPAYHFFSRSNPKVILDTCQAVLNTAGVDCTCKGEKFRISCAVYAVGHKLSFSVRVFATEGHERRYAVEFQRRQGDVLLFNQCYRSAKTALEASGLIEGIVAHTKPAPPVVPTLESLPSLDGIDSGEQTRLTCKNLQSMAISKFVDVKSQAVAALCDMTNNASMSCVTMMMSEGVVDTLVRELSSEFEEIFRPAVTAIANMAHRRKDVCDAILAADGLKAVLKLTSSETLQVVRECARCLSNFASCVGGRIDNDEFRSVVRTLVSSEDSRARTYTHEMLSTLRITTI